MFPINARDKAKRPLRLHRRLPIACTVLSVSLGCSHCLPSMSMAHGSPPNFLYYCPHVGLCLYAIKRTPPSCLKLTTCVDIPLLNCWLYSSIPIVVINLLQPLQLAKVWPRNWALSPWPREKKFKDFLEIYTNICWTPNSAVTLNSYVPNSHYHLLLGEWEHHSYVLF